MAAPETNLFRERPYECVATDKNTVRCIPPEIGHTISYHDNVWLMIFFTLVYYLWPIISLTGRITANVLTEYIVKRLKQLFAMEGCSVGSLELCTSTGKIIFHDIFYKTRDFTVKVQDGSITLRQWIFTNPDTPIDIFDLGSCDMHFVLYVQLNGVDVEVYDRCPVFNSLLELFTITPMNIFSKLKAIEGCGPTIEGDQSSLLKTLRSIIPIAKVNIASGHIESRNRTLSENVDESLSENVDGDLSVHVEEAKIVCLSKPAHESSFRHAIQCKAKNIKSRFNFSYLVAKPFQPATVDVKLEDLNFDCQFLASAALVDPVLEEFQLKSNVLPRFSFNLCWAVNWILNPLTEKLYDDKLLPMIEEAIIWKLGDDRLRERLLLRAKARSGSKTGEHYSYQISILSFLKDSNSNIFIKELTKLLLMICKIHFNIKTLDTESAD